MNEKQEPIYNAKELGTGKMLVLGVQHLFAMFGATVLVPILTGLSVSAIPGERNGYPLQLFLPGEFHGQRSLAGYSPCDCRELDTTEKLSMRILLPHKK